MSWPSDEANFLPKGANDFNDNGVNDLAYYQDSLIFIMDPSTQEILLEGRLLRETSLGRLTPGIQTVPVGELGDLAAGLYFVQLSGPTGSRTVRLVKP